MNSSVNEKLTFCIRESFYNGSLPYFYQESDFPGLNEIKNNWQVVWEEVKNYEASCGNISGLNTYSPPELEGANAWNNIYLENFMWRFHENRRFFPKTCALLENIPSCTLAAISVLSPFSTIAPHHGDTNAVIRCHLGLQIPAPYPICGIRVGDKERAWQNGGLVLFTEAHLHTTWNKSEQKRYLLVFDIVNPKWVNKKKWICASVLGAQTFVFLEKKILLLKRIPDSWLPSIHACLTWMWSIYLPIQRNLGFIYWFKKN